MDLENENAIREAGVRELQAALFSVATPKGTGSFLANFLLKTTQMEDGDVEEEQLIPKMKESVSKDFLTTAKDLSLTPQLPRWPTECQVLEERVSHIAYSPPAPEPYYVPSGREVQPKPVGDECGIIVYQYHPISAVNYFSRSSIGGSKYLLPTCPCPEEDTLRFESRFESGNLAKAIRITASYYELYLRTDLYTNRYMQWFYFRVTNMKKDVCYRFSIVNLSKDSSLYLEGMQPLMYSMVDAQLHSIGWRRCGDNITYFSNNEYAAVDESDQPTTYTLTFTIYFPHDNDAVYMAHSYPYTYSDLQDYVMDMSNHPVKSTFSTLRLLCRTLAGNNVYYVTITSPPATGDSKRKKAIVLTARVHPGETPSSWMMKGILDFLTSDCGPAKELRDRFIFKIVPMLNPDGVIVGNYRCSLTGRDLNRQYRTVIKETYPSIFYTKLMIRRLLEECGVAIYCDLHAHSRKHNIFIYGCENRKGPDKRLHEQIFPLMLHKNAADKFSFEDCRFKVLKCKEGTGRVVMWMMGIANSYTMEASFGGSVIGSRAETHFTAQDYEQMGKAFCQTLVDFYDNDPRKERLRFKIINRLIKEGSNADEPANIPLSDYSSDNGVDSSSSDDEGRGAGDISVLSAPPSSPNIAKTFKPKLISTKGKLRSPLTSRKPFPLSKPQIGFDKKSFSESSSESEPGHCPVRQKCKSLRKKRKKKKNMRKKNQFFEHSDSEMHKKKSPPRCLSVLDLSSNKLRSQSWSRSATAPKPILDHRKTTMQQLAEVQAKLRALRNKVWMGVGDGDLRQPLSWGSPNIVTTIVQQNTMLPKRKPPKPERVEKKTGNKKEKPSKMLQNGLKRQTAIRGDLTRTEDANCKIRKSKSLPDTTAAAKEKKKNSKKPEVYSCDEDGGINHKATAMKKKKKTNKPKLVKKVNNIIVRKRSRKHKRGQVALDLMTFHSGGK